MRAIDTWLLILSAATLAAGGLCWAAGRPLAAQVLWLAGVAPVLLALSLSIVKALMRRQPGVDVLAWIAIAMAVALGESPTAAIIALMVAGGRALERYAEQRAEREMTALLQHVPRAATRFESGEWRQADPDAIRSGDRLLVRAGDVVPVDGTLAGQAQLDESSLSGESRVLVRQPGEFVRSGAVNAGAPFEMRAAAAARDSTFAGIVRMVREARGQRSPSARLADRYALVFVIGSLLIAGGSWLLTGDPLRALGVLVVATPCPLILAVPVAIVSGISRCARRGVLVKGGGALERLGAATILFFDKTGTLTGGNARLVAIEPAPGVSTQAVLRLAASLGQASGHVVSASITVAARERGVQLAQPLHVRERAGAGVEGEIDGQRVTMGSFAYVREAAPAEPWSTEFLRRIGYEGAAAVFVAAGGKMMGAIQLADEIRLETPRTLRMLRQQGIRQLVMLTGDRRDVAQTLGAILGVTDVRAEQTPADKLAAIAAARKQGIVVMVGDGVNDAPALAAADVGIAMGARGAAASSEAADVVLLVDRLDRIVDAMRVARRARRIALQSVLAGMGLSVVAMGVAAAGYLPPMWGAILQEAIDVAVIVNALRVLVVAPPAQARLAPADAAGLMAGHAALEPLMARIRELADGLPAMPKTEIASALKDLHAALARDLLPHERRDDTEIYPRLGDLLGGDDPMAAMSTTHREIFRVIAVLGKMIADIPPEGPDPESLREFQRLLYGLDAIVRLHCVQEDEIFHTLAEAA
ncbi:heavy metal translocating P-type ATPase [Bordetella genomosp. 9]|uniref:P-type Zn(2+) transporter n=1 Tax=Bordetella genomosp. 9 TaxID=1416803 RepID=A0A261RG26_9BORD|nr:heavy metal translocating P-type ATPase [Bordetella genomosp. 9]OZI23974.1 heavy metal translocating P-type ATPase [Bordetella genomosp. 9]